MYRLIPKCYTFVALSQPCRSSSSPSTHWAPRQSQTQKAAHDFLPATRPDASIQTRLLNSQRAKHATCQQPSDPFVCLSLRQVAGRLHSDSTRQD